ncbi:MAG: prolipoprotein diacylglyceryl transferase [Bacilli bacterium]|nr:prolipoprotein diacylglyceryl transferase [Bacilli bacterium]
MIGPVAFEFLGFEIRWYSICILAALVVAYILIMNESRRQKVKTDYMFNMMFWTIIFGIIGARLYYVLFSFTEYKNNPIEIVQIWKGGLAIHGGIIAGLITVLLYCKKYKVNTMRILDICAPALLIAQGIGRWGNFFNFEAYGSITTYSALENMKIIPGFVIDNMYINGSYRLPMFYFEFLACLIGFLLILFVRRRKYIKIGQVFSFYLVWYGIARFFIEIFRNDSLMAGSLKIAQVVSICMVVLGVIIFILKQRKPILEDLYNRPSEEIKF